ncbi:MAG: DUF4038 domain-containing protein [Firmicutes bacterium]|nr:DUF4038 domain-containing protein [Bacillota bacterium]
MSDILSIAKNGRYFLRDGKPFFWLGDTAWLLFRKLSMEDTKVYLENRAKKGFTVIQATLVHTDSMQNQAGSLALLDERFDNPNPDMDTQSYWAQVNETIRYAASLGLVMALLPAWCRLYSEGALNPDTVEPYAEFLAQRFGHYPNVLWLVGGDVRGDQAYRSFDAMGKALRKRCPDQLIGYHPFGRCSSSMWFHQCEWLDFNMFQSGHRDYTQIKLNAWDDKVDVERWVGENSFEYVRQDLAMEPPKPTLDGEPSYELIPHGLHDSTNPYWQAHDVRRYAYWSLLSGSAGHTYGDNAIMQFWHGAEKSAFSPLIPWQESLHNPGSAQMMHVRNIMEALHWYKGSACQELLIGNNGKEYAYNLAFASKTAACVYTYSGTPFQVNTDLLPFAYGQAYWLDPMIGIASLIGTVFRNGAREFTPPDKRLGQLDWLLIITKNSLAFPVSVPNKPYSLS